MTENELTSQNALFTSSPEVASPHLRICGTQAVEERPREGFPLESGVARRAFKGTSADDGKGGEIARPKYVAPPIFTFSQPVDVTLNQIAEKPESIFGTSRGAISTLLAPPVSPPPSAHPAFRTPPSPGATSVFGGGSTTTSFNHSSKPPLPSSPNIFGCLMQPPPLSLPSRWPPMDKTSQNLSFGQNLFRCGATPATSSEPSGLFGPPVQPSPGTLFGAPPANGGQPPFASPEVAINVPSTGNAGLSSASAPTFSSPGQGHQIISIELRLLRRKNDELEKEAKKLRKENNDLKEDAKRWREGKHELESLAQLFDAAKKKLDAEEVSKNEELTRIKIELQLALLEAANLQDELEKEKKSAQNVMDRRESRMKDMQTQTENTNYEVQGPQGEDQAQKKMNDEPPSAGRDQKFGKRKCPEDVDEARKKRKREKTVDVESSTREDSNPHNSIESNEFVDGPLMIDLPDEEIKIVAEVNSSTPGDVSSKEQPKKYQPQAQQIKLKAREEQRVNVVDRSARDNITTDKYGTSWQFIRNEFGVVKMVFCPLCPFRPSGKFPSTRLKLANLEGHLQKVHEGRKEKASLCLWCPDCGESVSAPSLHPHLEEHTKRNSNDSNCQAVAGRASRPARNICFWCPDCEESVSAPSLQSHLQEHKKRNSNDSNCQELAGRAPRQNIWMRKDIFVPGVLADKSI